MQHLHKKLIFVYTQKNLQYNEKSHSIQRDKIMLKIAICDDEQLYQEKIQKLVGDYLLNHDLPCEFHLFSSGREFLESHEIGSGYHIVFMDISMDSMDGIQTATRLRSSCSDTFLVLVTAFIDYVLEGYKVNAMRYLLKDTLESSITECMDAILLKMRTAQVTFHFTDGERKLRTDRILYVESRKHKSLFFYKEKVPETLDIYRKLDEIEQTLSGYGFLRIHKSYLVNMKHIRKINNYTAFLDTGEELPIPRPRFQKVKEAFVAYKGAF